MATYVIDAPAAIELVGRGFEDAGAHSLMAPTLLRSQTLSLLHEAVTHGRLSSSTARERLERVGALPIRLLGDFRLRLTAWKVADQLGWAGTYDAEYVALTRLHGDALITGDPVFARAVAGVVELESLDVLL
jgi:predicted nucleic acid-binding protein